MSSAPVAPVRKALILDANILIRAVLGRRVLSFLETYAERVHFLAPEMAYAEATARVAVPAFRLSLRGARRRRSNPCGEALVVWYAN